MSLDTLRATLPDHAKDIRITLSAVMHDTLLTQQQKWGAFVAAAHATGFAPLIAAVEADAEALLAPEAVAAAKSAAALMAMNNVYFRALHLMKNQEYVTLRSGLRMNLLADPGVERGDHEFWCFIVSAMNGCAACMDAHEEELRRRDWRPASIQMGLRIGAVVAATAAVLRAESR